MPIPQRAVERNAVRTDRRAFAMTLLERRTVSRNTDRFTFTAPEFTEFAVLGPDEYFGLIVPQRDLPLPDGVLGVYDDLREVFARITESHRPDLRWYTVRAHRPALAEIDVDVVLHGESGPASRWATHARVGEVVGYREAHAPYIAPVVGHQLFVADETALPALAAILETEPTLSDPGVGDGATVLVEVPHPDDLPPIATGVEIRRFDRGAGAPGSLVLPALAAWLADEPPTLGFAWLCGESALATGARRQVIAATGIDPAEVMFSGYWRLGAARG